MIVWGLLTVVRWVSLLTCCHNSSPMIPGERASDRSLQLFVPEAGPAKTKKRLWYLLKLWQWLPHIQLNYFKSQLFSFSFEEWVDIKTNRLIRYMLALPQKQQSDFPTQHQVRIWNLKDSKGSPVVIPFPTSRGLGFLTNCPPTRPRGGVSVRVSILGVTG